MTLTDFLLARIAEDEQVARKASPGPWGAQGSKYVSGGYTISSDRRTITHATETSRADCAHIIRHDPARVLAECEAKRRIISMGWAQEDYIYRSLALPYAAHPDYREEWRP